jgi:hypothetical protein
MSQFGNVSHVGVEDLSCHTTLIGKEQIHAFVALAVVHKTDFCTMLDLKA